MESISEFAKRQLEYIDIEHQQEIEDEESSLHGFDDRQLQKKGICLTRLRVTGTRTGLGGKV
jgi:hypothetical protein